MTRFRRIRGAARAGGWLRGLLAGVVCGGVVLAGCVTEGPPPRPMPRPLPQQPAAVEVDRIGVFPSPFPEDTNDSGYFDTITMTVYLFDTARSRHPGPVSVPGRMLVELVATDEEVLARWELSEEQTEAAKRMFPPGPGYQLRLNMTDVATDRVPYTRARVRCTFLPRVGDPVGTDNPPTVVVGRTR